MRTATFLLVLIVTTSLAAPWYAGLVSGTDPFRSTPVGQVAGPGSPALLAVQEGGLGLGVVPAGPGWRGAYLLGADAQGRDVAARLLYGGRASLLVAGGATLLCMAAATFLGLLAGFAGGWVDALLARALDLLWAFPVFLLAISLAVVSLQGGLRLGPLHIAPDSLLLPTLIIAVAYIPYVARPVRAQVLALARAEFVTAARVGGATPARILAREVLPGVVPTLLAFAPLVLAISLLTESALSFLGIGVQPPSASWGSLIHEGLDLLFLRPLVAILPGLAIGVTVLALNLLAEGMQARIDPRRAAP